VACKDSADSCSVRGGEWGAWEGERAEGAVAGASTAGAGKATPVSELGDAECSEEAGLDSEDVKDAEVETEVEAEAIGSEEEEGEVNSNAESAVEVDSVGVLEVDGSSTSIRWPTEADARDIEFEHKRLQPWPAVVCLESLFCLSRLDLLVEQDTPLAGSLLLVEEERVTIVGSKANR